ncbi:DUF502 domain-containing protein [Parathalassolituus penaei]|uniref:DUF502 domain-containing protein n=1 Tax=Parathalassolituus penaei TaxID=2997323 RepID=A0A9X3ITL8_9GAMM|nr:DUF502 domain-containing protein [Parathalassolituus penaei]MCY0966024.1 DUF502 domain-containing protein [Parathalassolituus penaei]
MRYLLRIVLRGSAVTLPMVVTAWILWSALEWLNHVGLKLLEWISMPIPEIPGTGLIVMLATLLVIGLLFQINPISWLFQELEDWLLRFPVVKTLYGAVKDFAGMFEGKKKQSQQVVLVNMPGQGTAVGFITSPETPLAVSKVMPEQDLVTVYLPMSYMVGGYTLFLPRTQITPVDWSFEDAMRFALTAGVSQSTSRLSKGSNPDKSSDKNDENTDKNRNSAIKQAG